MTPAEAVIEPMEITPVLKPLILYPYLKVCHIAKYLQYSERTVYDLLERGAIKASKTQAGQWRAKIDDVDAYMQSNIYQPEE